jgi:methanogenic corrinoid protein MtbC1
MELLDRISEALQKGKAKDVKAMVQEAVDSGVSAAQILNEGLLSGMNVVGIKFKNNEVYVPDVLIAARAMKAGTEILKPLLIADGVKEPAASCSVPSKATCMISARTWLA